MKEIAENIFVTSSCGSGPFQDSCVYLAVGEQIALVETGTTRTVRLFYDEIQRAGVDRSRIHHIIATHIHLDHSGGVGWLVGKMPWVRVYAHPSGIRHLADPTRLLKSAERVYGGMEAVHALHGDVLPVPEANLSSVVGAEIDCGRGLLLRGYDGQGHAPHHVLIHDGRSGALFVGEALGHYLPGLDLLYPAVAPPGFDMEKSLQTMRRIEEMSPRLLIFSQFGATERVRETIEKSRAQLCFLNDFLEKRLDGVIREEEIVQELVQHLDMLGIPPTMAELVRSMLYSCISGFAHYFRRASVQRTPAGPSG